MNPLQQAHLNIAAQSHPGMSGKNNEDNLSVSAYEINQNGITTRSVLAIVSDGIGGHRAGEIASKLAIDIIRDKVAASDAQQPIATLTQAITQASRTIAQEAQANPEQRGMGATCACAWIIGDRLYIATVGDSRIYFIRDNQITQLTTDHTWVQEAIEVGALTPEQARTHPNAHVLRRYLGSLQRSQPDFRLRLTQEENEQQMLANQGLLLQPADMLLLCSDGLTDLVHPDEILQALSGNNLNEAVTNLINLANERGGHDNITIIAMRVPELTIIQSGGLPIPKPTSNVRFTRNDLIIGGVALLIFTCMLISGIVILSVILQILPKILQP
ncbi:MAG: protein phosphatase 2C domain-containing protein [Anaerolineales bacterium]